MDLGSIIGLVVCFGGFIGGFLAEGGQLMSLVQGTAAMIVFFVALRRAVLERTPRPEAVAA